MKTVTALLMGMISFYVILNITLFAVTNIYQSWDESSTTVTINKQTILNRSDTSWIWKFTSENIEFSHACPDYKNKIIVDNYHGLLLQFKDHKFIYGSNAYTMVYEDKMLGFIQICITFYDSTNHPISYVTCPNNNKYDFYKPNLKLILNAELSGKDWILNPTEEIDLSLYGTFLSYTSFYPNYLNDNYSILSDYCNLYLFSGIAADIIGIIIFLILLFVLSIYLFFQK